MICHGLSSIFLWFLILFRIKLGSFSITFSTYLRSENHEFAGLRARRRARSWWRFLLLTILPYFVSSNHFCGLWRGGVKVVTWSFGELYRKPPGVLVKDFWLSKNTCEFSLDFRRPFDFQNETPKPPKWSQNGAKIDWKRRSKFRGLFCLILKGLLVGFRGARPHI